MSVVCKMFIQSRHQSPDGYTSYDLSVVCRGETNKDWAAATPSGQMKSCPANDVLDEVWGKKLANPSWVAEVYVTQTPNPDGDWKLDSCAFSYGGCAVTFRRSTGGPPWGGELTMTINAKPATASLRNDFARALDAGEPQRYDMDFMPAEQPDATAA